MRPTCCARARPPRQAGAAARRLGARGAAPTPRQERARMQPAARAAPRAMCAARRLACRAFRPRAYPGSARGWGREGARREHAPAGLEQVVAREQVRLQHALVDQQRAHRLADQHVAALRQRHLLHAPAHHLDALAQPCATAPGPRRAHPGAARARPGEVRAGARARRGAPRTRVGVLQDGAVVGHGGRLHRVHLARACLRGAAGRRVRAPAPGAGCAGRPGQAAESVKGLLCAVRTRLGPARVSAAS
jgi:hypothetical protein